MHHPLSSLIDQIVQNAERRGDFDNLPGAGKPLVHPENPTDAVLHRIMAEADAKSPVVILRQQILSAQAHLKTLTDPDARSMATSGRGSGVVGLTYRRRWMRSIT